MLLCRERVSSGSWALSLIGCVTIGKGLDLSEPQFSESNYCVLIIKLLQGLDVLIFLKSFKCAWCIVLIICRHQCRQK